MDCKFCDKIASATEPPGGWVLRNDLVSASVIEGSEVPGWYVLHVNRHAEGWMGLNPAEAAAIGAANASLARALKQVTGVDRVYTYSIGENFPHFHMQIGSPPQDAPEPGRALLTQILNADPRYVDKAAAFEMAAAVAALVGGGS